MATKAQLENENRQLTGELALLKQELEMARAETEQAKRPVPITPSMPETCINCGQALQPIQKTEAGYRCPLCGHEWTDEEEKAPFRRGS